MRWEQLTEVVGEGRGLNSSAETLRSTPPRAPSVFWEQQGGQVTQVVSETGG